MTRTLSDMAPAEQDLHVGTWFELLGASYLVILASPDDPYDGYATVVIPCMAKTTHTPMTILTPRLDLPRAWTPTGEHVPGTWDDDNGHNLMRRFQSEWEWKPDTPQHVIDQHTKETP